MTSGAAVCTFTKQQANDPKRCKAEGRQPLVLECHRDWTAATQHDGN